MIRGLLTWWLIFVLSLAGTLFPHLFAQDFLDDARIVRWLAVPLLIASTALLASHYLGISPEDLGLHGPSRSAALHDGLWLGGSANLATIAGAA